MFARPHKISPNVRYGQETDHTFTKIAIPLLEKTKLKQTGHDDSAMDTPKSTSSTRTGDSLSYSTNSNDHTRIPRSCSRRMYRVVSYKEDSSGKKVIFDPLDGKTFSIGPGFANRVSNNVVLFETKKGALSERYPFNQCGAAKSGNGHFPRVLIAFDAWGDVKKRYGGAPSLTVEFAKAMKIVEFLDPPHPVPKRLCDRYVEPFFYTPADRAPPNRLRSSKHFKINKFFTADAHEDAPETTSPPQSPVQKSKHGHSPGKVHPGV